MRLLTLIILFVFVGVVVCSGYEVDEIRRLLQDYDDRIHSLSANQHALQEQIKAQANEIDSLNINIDRLNSENIELRIQMGRLEKEVELQTSTVNSKAQPHDTPLTNILDVDMKDNRLDGDENVDSEFTTNHTHNSSPNAGIQAKKMESEKGHGVVERPSRLLVSPSNSYVAFTAMLGDHAVDLGLHQTVIFDRIQTNIGGGYSADNGMFTAPEDGVYYFIASILSHSGEHIEAEITHNGNPVALIYAEDSTRYEQGTNSVILSLQAGDHVWVRTHDTYSHKAYGVNWSTFSGFRLSY